MMNGDEVFFPGIAVIDRYEKSLRESEEKFRILSEASSEGIVIHDNGYILQVNSAFCRLFGYLETELLGKQFFSFIAKQYHQLIIDKIDNNNESPCEVLGFKKSGDEIHFEIVSRRIESKDRNIRIAAFRDLGERRYFEDEIRRNQERYKMLVDSASDAIFVMDEDGKFLQTNSKGYLLLGYSLSELLQMNIRDVVPVEEFDSNPISFKEVVLGKTFFKERKLKCKDGSTIDVEASLTRLPEESIQAILRDITERKKTQEALLRSQENYKNLIEYSPDGIFIHDEHGEVIFANPTALKIMGIDSLDQLGSRNLFSYVLSDYHDLIRSQKTLVDKGVPTEFSIVKISRADGTIIEVESKPIRITYEGKPSTLVVYHDISYQRKLEKEQLRAEIAEESNKRLQIEIREREKVEIEIREGKNYIASLIESSLDIICAVDRDGRITEFNKAAQDNFGYTRKEIIGKHVSILYRFEEERVSVNNEMERYGKFSGEIVNRKKSGQEFVAYLSASVLKNQSGETIGFMGVSRDITERKDTEEKIKKSLKEKEVLLKEVHHRVKNNLQVISSILNLQSSYLTDKKTIDLLKESQNRIKSMSFIHEILYQTKDFSRINFKEYVSSLVNNLLHSYSRDKNIKLELDIDNVYLNLDLAIPCGLVVNELLSNSFKYAFVGKKDCMVKIFIAERSDFLHMEISDNGTGLPKEIDFRNTETLGLQLVMTLVEQLEGDIMLDNINGASYRMIFKNDKKNRKDVENEYFNC